MTDMQTNSSQEKGQRPSFRAWLVQDQDGGEPIWIELSGLWPTKSGKGYSGSLKTPVSTTTGRIVIMPAMDKPGD
ncbi:MAG: hypothetical protein AAGF94_20040 [Pseudomonadota bacterium]